MVQHYCKEYGCLATYPCTIHPDTEIQQKRIQGYFDLDTEGEMVSVKITELPIKVIYVITLPCGHNFPVSDKKIPYTEKIICSYCDQKYLLEMKEDICELTRIK